MANRTLFRSLVGKLLPRTDAVNAAGGHAYQTSPRHALAQYASTGCLGNTFYASATEQLDSVLKLCATLEPEFIAQTALYSRQQGYMKDMPALLCAVLSVKSPQLLERVFERVIDNARMLRNFVQIVRSGAVGRKSLGTVPKRLVLRWLNGRSDEQLFTSSVGTAPSLADVIRMVHPKPSSTARSALFGYLLGREYDFAALPERVQQFVKFQRNTNPGKVPVPDVPFQLLTSLPLTAKDWRQIARNASWQTTRMNLNTYQRHGVFADPEMVQFVANRLRNAEEIARSRVFPYQLLAAYSNAASNIPGPVAAALQDAMELAIGNVPAVKGKVYVCPDISGSMHSPVTGDHAGGTTSVRCIDIAALVAAAILRKNPDAEVIPFESNIVRCELNPRDSVMTNARKLASLPCGGTNCSAPLAHLNDRKANGDLIVYVSDNESWIDSPNFGRFGSSSTEMLTQWSLFTKRNPTARMVCIDIQPNATTQAKERADIVNIGGFSDQVFRYIADVAEGRFGQDHWVQEIEKINL